ncbi:hypothetical protein ACJMK2_005769 [Sinanodonta woodiana]|uniref:Coiled-coil domain-containing protein 149 n=1 Tax=Sinanodonta woodiana TaxID=1069815 RepID=A0ABD3VSR2_SINWO
MASRRIEQSSVRISDEEYSRLENKFEALRNEYQICKQKLDSKGEALLILSKELDQCRSERDQFKLMAEQLRERYQALKKQNLGQVPMSSVDTKTFKQYSDMQSQSLAKLLFESKEHNKSQQFEMEDLKQKLHDAQGDIKLLREQIARQRVGTTDEGMNTRHFPAHEREDLVKQLEASREEFLQLQRDLQQVLDEKEELEREKDAYKMKYERLNQELNYILKGDEKRILDIDALVMENKYLNERIKQMEEEKSMAMATVSKYKTLLERKKTKGCMKLGQDRSGGMVMTRKEVEQLLDNPNFTAASAQAMSDLQALARSLLDTVKDKNLALSHQRKTNKILGNRVSELEKKIKTLEVAGLWSVPSHVSASLERLRTECDEARTLIPQQILESSVVTQEVDGDVEVESMSISDSTRTSSTSSPEHHPGASGDHQQRNTASIDEDQQEEVEVLSQLSSLNQQSVNYERELVGMSRLTLEDLDLLPTKEVTSKPADEGDLHTAKNDPVLKQSEKGSSKSHSKESLQSDILDHFGKRSPARDWDDGDKNHTEDIDKVEEEEEDDEQSEKIRLLMESATQKIKMCAAKHKNAKLPTAEEEDINVMDKRSVETESENLEKCIAHGSPTSERPSDSEGQKENMQHSNNVEC